MCSLLWQHMLLCYLQRLGGISLYHTRVLEFTLDHRTSLCDPLGTPRLLVVHSLYPPRHIQCALFMFTKPLSVPPRLYAPSFACVLLSSTLPHPSQPPCWRLSILQSSHKEDPRPVFHAPEQFPSLGTMYCQLGTVWCGVCPVPVG